MGYLSRCQECLLPHTYTGTIQEISEISQGRIYQIKALRFGLSTASVEFTVLAKMVKLMAIHKGIRINQYLDDWLARARSQQVCLQHTQELNNRALLEVRLPDECEKIRAAPQASLRLRRLPVRPQVRLGPTHTGPVAEPSAKNTGTSILTGLSGLAIHVPDRSANCHRETSSPRPTT